MRRNAVRVGAFADFPKSNSITFKLLFNSLGVYCKVEYSIPFPDLEKRNPGFSSWLHKL